MDLIKLIRLLLVLPSIAIHTKSLIFVSQSLLFVVCISNMDTASLTKVDIIFSILP